MTTKKEMARLIEQMADTPEATQWLRERNEAMRRSLRDISLSAVQYDAAGGQERTRGRARAAKGFVSERRRRSGSAPTKERFETGCGCTLTSAL